MPELFIDENYKSALSLRETETAIKSIKEKFMPASGPMKP